MNKYFYSHLLEVEPLILELEKTDLSDEEKNNLSLIIDANMHHLIVDIILSELSEKDKKIFLMHLSLNNHDKIWEFLEQKTEDIENKIKKAAKELKEKFTQDIKEIKLDIQK